MVRSFTTVCERLTITLSQATVLLISPRFEWAWAWSVSVERKRSACYATLIVPISDPGPNIPTTRLPGGDDWHVLDWWHQRTKILHTLSEQAQAVRMHCKNVWVTSTIFWSSQLHACCVRDTLQTSKGCFLFESKLKCSWEASPQLGSSYRKLHSLFQAYCKTRKRTAEWTHSADSPEVKICFDLMPKLPLRTLSEYMNRRQRSRSLDDLS